MGIVVFKFNSVEYGYGTINITKLQFISDSPPDNNLLNGFSNMDIQLTCSVGVLLGTKCSNWSEKNLNKTLVYNLPENDQRILKLRLKSEDLIDLCDRHSNEYLYNYTTVRKITRCCDPLRLHKKPVNGSKIITLELSDIVNAINPNIRLIPGEKLCPRCRFDDKLMQAPEPVFPEPSSPCQVTESEVAHTPITPAAETLVPPIQVISALAESIGVSTAVQLNRYTRKRRVEECVSLLEKVRRSLITDNDQTDCVTFSPDDYKDMLESIRDKVFKITIGFSLNVHCQIL